MNTSKDAIRLIHISEELASWYGGPAVSIPNLAISTLKAGYQAEVVSTYVGKPSCNDILNASEISWKQFPATFSKLRFSNSLDKYLANVPKDNTVFHVNNLWNFVPYSSYKHSRRKKIPLVVSTRGMLVPEAMEASRLKKFISWNFHVKNMLNYSSCIHVTNGVEADVVRGLGIDVPVALIPNAMDLSPYANLIEREEAAKELSMDASKRYMLFMARIHPHKGLEMLLECWKNLRKSFPNWELLIVGPSYDKHYNNMIQEVVEQYGIKDSIHFLGERTGHSKLCCYALADFFALPTKSENFGLSILEALASRVPVITTNTTPWQVISSNQAGWWVERKTKDFFDAMKSACSLTEKERVEMGNRSSEIAERFSLSRVSSSYSELYQSLINGSLECEFMVNS